MNELIDEIIRLNKNLSRRAIYETYELIKVKLSPYDGIAKKLTNLLLSNYRGARREAINETIRIINNGIGKLTNEEINYLLDRLGNILGINLATNVESVVDQAVMRTYQTALKELLGLLPSYNMVDYRALEWQRKNHIYWIGERYNRELNNKLKDIGNMVVEQGLSRTDAGKLFRELIGTDYQRSRVYWENLSNHIVTRARTFGAISACETAEIQSYEIRAVLDHRTSPICRRMHGTRYDVQKGIELRDKIIESDNPEDVKRVDKWYTMSELEGIPDDKLPLSMALPPYHFGCRTTIVAVS